MVNICPLFRHLRSHSELLYRFFAAEGDSELSGNAIEASLTGTFRITVLPQATLPPALVSMKAPILETKDYILVHGYAYDDYITELDKPR